MDLPGVMWPLLSNILGGEMSYLCYRNMAPCVLDLHYTLHYNLYTRGRGDAGSSAQRYGPRSNWTYSLVFTHSNVFFKHGHFEEGATLLSPWAGAILIRVNIGRVSISIRISNNYRNIGLTYPADFNY
jgi:hypothetical protein